MDPAHLRNIPVFSDLDDEELDTSPALAAEVSVPDGKELVREGDYSYDVLAIEEGTASVERDGERIADLGPGDVVGEMGVLERSQRNATVRRDLADAPRHSDRMGHPPSAQVAPGRGRAPAGRRRAAQRARLSPSSSRSATTGPTRSPDP